MPTNLTPAERSQRSRIGGLARSAKYDGREVTAKARAAFYEQFEDEVDPDRTLEPEERARRAAAARKAHFARLAYLSAKARRARAEAS